MNFGVKAHTYDKHSSVQSDLAGWVAEWLPDDMSDSSAIEFGAGTGLLTKHILNRGAKVCATDRYHNMIEEGMKRAPSAEWSLVNAWDPAMNSPDYNFVLSSALLQWAPEPVDVLKKWKALLKDDGRMVSGIITEGSLSKLDATLPEANRFLWRPEAEWIASFKAAGWHVVRTECIKRSYQYNNALDLMRSIHGTGAVIANSLPAFRLREFIRRMDDDHLDESGLCENWCFTRIEAKP